MMKRFTYFCYTLLILSSSPPVYSFDLFDADRGKPATLPPPQQPASQTTPYTPPPNPFVTTHKLPPPRPKAETPMPPQKDFILRGTSRIGDNRSAVLKGPDNKEFVQFFKHNTRTKIENYEGYYLLGVSAREIRLEYPADSPCRESNEQNGLKCNTVDNGRTALLSLMRGKPLIPPKPPVVPKPAKRSKPVNDQRDEERKRREKLYKNFKRKVIRDEDVPPGMRVVRTPFGDRLVPIK